VGQTACFSGDTLEDVVDEGVHDVHGIPVSGCTCFNTL
jgi:hypothetical protein